MDSCIFGSSEKTEVQKRRLLIQANVHGDAVNAKPDGDKETFLRETPRFLWSDLRIEDITSTRVRTDRRGLK